MVCSCRSASCRNQPFHRHITLRSAAAFSGRLERLVRFTMKCGNIEGTTNQFHPGISISVCLFLLPSNILFFLPCFNSTPCLDNSYLFSLRTPEEYAPILFPPSGGPPLNQNIVPLFPASARDSQTVNT